MKIVTDETVSAEEMEKSVAKAPIVGWVSGGAASAVACHLGLRIFPDMRLVRIDPLGELPDVGRFVADFSEKIGRKIETISIRTHGPERFHSAESHLDILRQVRAIKFPTGAPCTTILKRNVREAFCEQEGLNWFIWGFTKDEAKRAERIKSTVEGFHEFPLIDNNLTKADCFKYIEELGLILPENYRLGLNNANCVICVKGGMGYMNLCRKLFPDKFKELAILERQLGHTCIRDTGPDGKRRPVYLDELDPERGLHLPIYVEDCGSVGEGCEIQRSINANRS